LELEEEETGYQEHLAIAEHWNVEKSEMDQESVTSGGG